MSVMAAALVLAWICLILLAFGLAGILWQLRGLQAELTGIIAYEQRPLRGRQVAEFAGPPRAVLVTNPGCGLCATVSGGFAELAASTPELRFETLSYRAPADWPTTQYVRHRVDERLYQNLDVPWTPALLVTDEDGVIIHASPVESSSDLRNQVKAAAESLASPAEAVTETARS